MGGRGEVGWGRKVGEEGELREFRRAGAAGRANSCHPHGPTADGPHCPAY